MANSQKKQKILEVAARLFRDKGYPATSMRHLADEVQLKASSLYNHIGSKEEILQTICFDNAHRFAKEMKGIQENSTLDVTEKVKALIQLHIEMATQEITSVTAFNDEWRHLSEPHLSNFMKMRKEYEGAFKALLQKGMEEGTFKQKNASILLYTLLSSFRWLYDWYKPGKSIQIQQIKDEMIDSLMNGIS